MNKKSVLGGIILGAIVTLFIIEYLSLNIQILHNIGIVKSNIGVYWNYAGTNETKEINWGTLTPGSEKTVVVFIENAKNTSMYASLQTSNWNPIQASSYLSLSWNSSSVISPNAIVPVSFTLQVREDIIGITNFSFDIIITGEW